MGAIQKFLLEHEVPLSFDEVYNNLSSDLQDVWGQRVLPTGPELYRFAHLPDRIVSINGTRSGAESSMDGFTATGAVAFLLPTTPCAAPLIEQQLKFSIAGHDVELPCIG